MTSFTIIALAGLAVLVTCEVVDRFLSLAQEFWAIGLVVLGVGAAWLAGLDAFAGWGFPLRTNAIGITLTGFLIGGAGYFWREILHFFTGLSRKLTDEAATLEKSEGLRRVA